MTPGIDQAVHALAQADALFITAGAGLTASAGLNYTDTDLFAREFPGMRTHGVSAQYEMIGRTDLPAEVFWGFWSAHVDLVRFRPAPRPTYRDLLALAMRVVDPTALFVLTSNVEQLFARNGFDPTRIHTPQGDYALLQCAVACTNDVWRWDEERNDMRGATDPADQRIPTPLIPRCRNCGGDAWINVRIDAHFIEDHFAAGADALATWASEHRTRRGVVLELGAGWNTPTVARFPGEAFAASEPTWDFIRVSLDDPAMTPELGGEGIGLRGDAGTILTELAAGLGSGS